MGDTSQSSGSKVSSVKTGFGNFGSAVSKGFGITKQFVKQKIGKAESSTENPEFLAALERLHVVNRNFTKLQKITSSVFTAFPKAENDGKGFLENEIKYANKLEKDYKIARLDYDARSETLKELKAKNTAAKIPQAQKNFDESTEAYEKVKAELQKTIQYIDEQKDRIHKDTIATCCELLQSLKPDWERKEGDPEPVGDFAAPGETTTTTTTSTTTTAPSTDSSSTTTSTSVPERRSSQRSSLSAESAPTSTETTTESS